MEDYLMEIMKRTSIFMILAQAVIHFRPNPSYEKYFKFLAGVMTIVILVIPLLEVVQSGIGVRYVTSMKQYADALAEITETEPDIAALAADPSAAYLAGMENEIRAKLEQYAEEKGYRICRTQIQGVTEKQPQPGSKTDTFGSVRITVWLLQEGSGEKEPDFAVRIEEITIQKEEKQETESAGKAETALQKAFAGLLGIEENRLEVKVIG